MTDYTLTAAQLNDFRNDIGDTGTPPAFEDDDLHRLFTRTEGDYDNAVLLAYDQLIGTAWRFNNYTQNNTQEQKKQVFDNLIAARANWQKRIDRASSRATVKMSRYISTPKRKKDNPYA
jgi:hypothetical protein